MQNGDRSWNCTSPSRRRIEVFQLRARRSGYSASPKDESFLALARRRRRRTGLTQGRAGRSRPVVPPVAEAMLLDGHHLVEVEKQPPTLLTGDGAV
jgi:hypothetical protein